MDSTSRNRVAYLLLVAVAFDLAVRYWGLLYVHVRRERYQLSHGPIDIPEAMYFDGIAMSLQIPLILVFFALHVASAVLFYRGRTAIGPSRAARFWGLWLIAWPMCIFMPFLFAP